MHDSCLSPNHVRPPSPSSSSSNAKLTDKSEPSSGVLETKCAAGFTFQMVNQAAQGHELGRTARAVIYLLTMGRTGKVLVEAGEFREPFAAEVATKTVPIPRCGRRDGRCFRLFVIVPLDLTICEDVTRIGLATVIVDLLRVDTGRTTAALEVQTNTGQIDKLARTPRAFDIVALVDV